MVGVNIINADKALIKVGQDIKPFWYLTPNVNAVLRKNFWKVFQYILNDLHHKSNFFLLLIIKATQRCQLAMELIMDEHTGKELSKAVWQYPALYIKKVKAAEELDLEDGM